MLKLMYITNDSQIAKIADAVGVDRVFVDLETVGKKKRQGGMNTVQSNHTIDDVWKIHCVLKKAQLLVRINPIYYGSKQEIDKVIENGADVLMLPYFENIQQVRTFLEIVDHRAITVLLVETPSAVEHLEEILSLDGINECHIGLNDLHLGYGMKFMFELLADGTVDKIAEIFHRYRMTFGFGGIARIGAGTIPAEKILAEHIRLGSQSVILSRSFCNNCDITDYAEFERFFSAEIQKLRQYERDIRQQDEFFFKNNHIEVQKTVKQIMESML